jgi:hypothetical protein
MIVLTAMPGEGTTMDENRPFSNNLKTTKRESPLFDKGGQGGFDDHDPGRRQ